MRFRVLMSLALGVALTSGAAAIPAFADESATIRIEPRPVQGATITIEEGVRVYRPLPPEKYVIVNPGGMTPLNLSINETRVTQYSTANNYHRHVHRYPHNRYIRSFIPAVGGFD
ncbi:MAG: hypothetical protein NW216_15340 [Hyphomicrobium sp.]|nr:hypothetical protein [Hyphomicrobium sp.]